MTYETQTLLLPERTEPQPDVDLLAGLMEAVGGDEFYAEMTLSPEEQARVTEGWRRGESLSLVTDRIDIETLNAREQALRAWKAELLADTTLDLDIKQLYRWKVNEYIANIKMMQASQAGDMKMFRRWNEFIYGKPDEHIYRSALDWVAHDAEKLLAIEEQHPAIVGVAQNVLRLLEGKRGYRELLIPDADTFEAVRADHMSERGYYGLLLAGVPVPEGKITREVGDPILEQVIHNIGSTKSIIDSPNATWGVTDAGVKRPASHNMPHKRFIGLGLGHEVGSHELERTNGARGPVAIAGRGLDRYESGNEPRAVVREQVIYDTFDEFGKLVRWRDILRRDIAIGYAWGVGEDAPKKSAEVYEFLNTIDRMYQVKLRPDDVETAHANAKAKTDALLLRILKGTDGSGGAYSKDKVYLEGHVAVWYTAATRGSQAISEGDLGKFDINNPRHISALQRLGLLPTAE